MNKQIEEMAKIIDKAQKWHDIHCENTRQCEICEYHKGQVHCSSNYIAEDLFNAGYRNVHDFAKWHAEEQLKLSENVSKETAREILQFLNEHTFQDASQQIVKSWFKETYDVEVE